MGLFSSKSKPKAGIRREGRCNLPGQPVRSDRPDLRIDQTGPQQDNETFPSERLNSSNMVVSCSTPSRPRATDFRTSAEVKLPLPSSMGVVEYFKSRDAIIAAEGTLKFDSRCRAKATELERRVDRIMRNLRQRDSKVYEGAKQRKGYAGQLHPRVAGDHFLSNLDLIPQTQLFRMAKRLPKGGHLHIHFNACLPPQVLLDIAAGMDRMFISSDIPLLPNDNFNSYEKCEIQFSLRKTDDKSRTSDIFCKKYGSGAGKGSREWMKLSAFLLKFKETDYHMSARDWLVKKLVFSEEETHNSLQTAAGAWEKFNGRTRMMKGLFNYETAYREYTRRCLEDFVNDNITYAEIRPNFMTTNQLFYDDGSGPMDNSSIMQIIIQEVTRFQKESSLFFGGLKVIYCTPRSLSPDTVKVALDECLQFKIRWPQWIAGFDLVGEEAKGRPLKDFVPAFLDFREKCHIAKQDIPFLFHCGETLGIGTSTDGNLVDALMLGAKRIGHGFALTRHPYIMQRMKEQGVCLELCPISNEVLGLTPRVSGHAMYQLLARNVHCTVNSDNGTLFRSSLSHDFYQVLIGSEDVGLFGWKQLILWSLQHACLSDAEREPILRHWEIQWKEFLRWAVQEYDDDCNVTAQDTI